MISLSVCIIAKNESAMIADCINSIASLAYEIILVDTGSTDRTVEIAKSLGALVINSPWRNDFSFSRNVALDAAKGDFILSIDADERLLNPEKLRKVLENANPQTGGWLIGLTSSINHHQAGNQNYVSSLLRLFRRDKQIRYEGIVHEQVINSIRRLELKIENTDLSILHLGYDVSPEEMNKKHYRNLELLNLAIVQNPNDSYNITQRAKTLNALNLQEEAQDDFVRSLELIPTTNQMRTRALNFGAINAYQLGNLELAESWALESLVLIPRQAFANFLLGEIYFETKRYGHAYEHYIQMREVQNEPPDVLALVAGDYNIPEDHLAYKIGRCHFLLKDYQSAGDEYAASFKLNNSNVLGLVGLANIAFNLKKYSEAKRLLETALQIDPTQSDIPKFLEQIEVSLSGVNQTVYSPKKYSENTNAKTLAVCMIVRNEEKMLAGCLDSIQNVADEIIIIDTGSNDATVEIAKKYGAKISYFEWINDFAAARNESLKLCTSDWILYLDADERLSPESQGYIKTYINNALPEVGGLICTIESDHSQMDGSNEMHRGGYPRLFRNLGYPKMKFVGRVHEQISPSIVDAGYNFAVSDLKIIHLGYNQSREVMEQKIKRNYTMLLAHVNEEPLNGYAWFQLGQTLGQMSLMKEAEDAIRFAINCGNLTDSIFASAAVVLAQMTGNKKNYAESLEWSEQSLAKAPNQIYGLTLKGYALLNLNRGSEAVEVFERALALLRSGASTLPSGSGGFDVVISEKVILEGIRKASL